jgi:uncharacterized protein YodC (DUF2158 family)
MQEFKFEPGDIVELKSGGPRMTICEIDGKSNCLCKWFDGNAGGERWLPSAALLIINRFYLKAVAKKSG